MPRAARQPWPGRLTASSYPVTRRKLKRQHPLEFRNEPEKGRRPVTPSTNLRNLLRDLACDYPPGKSILINRINVKPPAQKYSAFYFGKSEL
jgi:hypothetical protein